MNAISRYRVREIANRVIDGIDRRNTDTQRKPIVEPFSRTPAELAAEYAEAPAILSDSLRRSMGLYPPQRDAAE